MTRPPRFVDLYHAGQVAAGEIDDFVEAWHIDHKHVQVHVYLGLTWAEYRTWLLDGWLPDAAEHAQERSDAIWVGPDDERGFLLRTHPPAPCRPPCPIHWPTEHPLVDAPLYWDAQQRYLLRICAHGQLHPDPDDQQVRLHADLREHDCDGCCTAAVVDGQALEVDPLGPLLEGYGAAAQRYNQRRLT